MVFIESRSFTRRLHERAASYADGVLLAIEQDLMQAPLRGRLVRGLGGIRKARTSNPSRGKGTRSGFRYLYLYLQRKDHIHLLFLLDKNEQEDLGAKERAALRKLVAEIEQS